MAARGNNIKGITVKIGGDTLELTKALDSATKSAKETGAELSQVGKQLKYDPGNVTLLGQKHELLGKQIETSKEKLEKLNAAKATFWDTNDVNDEKAQASYRALEREIEKTEAGLKKAKQEFRETSEMVIKLGNTSTQLKKLGGEVTALGKSLSMKLTLPIAALSAAVVKVASGFDTEMSKVQALSGATGERLDSLRAKARELGSETKFSASQVASGFEYMSLAGWDVEQQLSGIDGVLDLAAATAMDLGEASDIVTDYLTAFGLSAEYAGKMADEMAYAQANSNTTVTQLGEAYQNSAANMHAAGQTMETTTALLEAMANQGTKGAQAGTQLAAVMRDITSKMKDGAIQIGDTSIAVQDADGNFRDLVDILADVETAVDGMGTAEQSAAIQTTFTARSVRAVNQLLTEGTGTIKGYREELETADGTAADMAATMQDNLAGQLTQLKSQLEEVAISFGELLMPIIRDVVAWIQDLVAWINSFDEDTRNIIVTIGLVMAAAGPLLLLVGSMITEVGKLVNALSFLYAHPVVAGLAAVAALVTAIAIAVGTATEAGDEYRKKADEIRDSLSDLNDTAEKTIAAGQGTASLASDMITRLEELRNKTDLTAEEQAEMADIVARLNELYPDLNLEIDAQTGALNKTNAELERYVENQFEAAKAEALYEKVRELYRKQAEAALNVREAEEALSEAREKNATLTREEMDAIGGHAVEVNNLKYALQDAKAAEEEVNQEIDRARGLYREATGELWKSKEATDATVGAMGELNTKNIEASDTFREVASISTETEKAYADSVTGIIESTQAAIDSQMNMFETFNEGSAMNTETLLENMRSQVEGVRNWEAQIAELADRGINQDLLQKLIEMGPAGADYMATFVEMSGDQLEEANSIWSESLDVKGLTDQWGLDLQESVATSIGLQTPGIMDAFRQSGADSVLGYYEGIMENLAQAEEASAELGDASVEELRDSLEENSPSKITEEAGRFFVVGLAKGVTENTAEAVAAVLAMSAALTAAFSQDFGRVASAARYAGAQLPRGMALGILDGQYLVVNAAQVMASAAVRAAVQTLQINSPSKVFGWIGEETVAGFVNELVDSKDEVSAAMTDLMTPPDVPRVGGAYGSASSAYNYGGITMNIYQQPGESGEALARRLLSTLNMQLRTLQRNGG